MTYVEPYAPQLIPGGHLPPQPPAAANGGASGNTGAPAARSGSGSIGSNAQSSGQSGQSVAAGASASPEKAGPPDRIVPVGGSGTANETDSIAANETAADQGH